MSTIVEGDASQAPPATIHADGPRRLVMRCACCDQIMGMAEPAESLYGKAPLVLCDADCIRKFSAKQQGVNGMEVAAGSVSVKVKKTVIAALERQVAAEEAPESAIAKAMRDDLATLAAEDKALTVKRCRKIARLANAAARFLRSTSERMEDRLATPHRGPTMYGPFGMGVASPAPDPDADEGDDPPAPPFNASGGMPFGLGAAPAFAPPVETFGNTMMREAMAALPKIFDKKPKVTDLVDAIDKAKKAGLEDVAEKLKAKLSEDLSPPSAPPALAQSDAYIVGG